MNPNPESSPQICFLPRNHVYYTKRSARITEKVKAELDRIVSVLVETGIVSKIILFGSRANGGERLDSDIDLCVLTQVKDRRPLELMADFHMKLWDVNTTPMDLLAYNEDNFYFHAKRPTSLEHEIAKNGVLIYEHC